jgi:uncharacterized protein DUF1353
MQRLLYVWICYVGRPVVLGGVMLGRLALFLVALCLVGHDARAQGQKGKYLDKLTVEMLDDGRKMRLLSDYRYLDEKNQMWVAPAGSVVDGASIPRALWSLVGSPLTGPYRNASVIHDYFCDQKVQKWEVVHRIFYEAMLVSGVDTIQAAYMYWAVFKFGPRWDVHSKIRKCGAECFGGILAPFPSIIMEGYLDFPTEYGDPKEMTRVLKRLRQSHNVEGDLAILLRDTKRAWPAVIDVGSDEGIRPFSDLERRKVLRKQTFR